MILIHLDRSFGCKTTLQQNEVRQCLEIAAHDAGLAGSVAIFWQHGSGARFIGPTTWKTFLQGVSLTQVDAAVNKKLTVDFNQLAKIA